MYSRSYYTDEEKITPPKNYDGTAFVPSPPTEAPKREESVDCAVGDASREVSANAKEHSGSVLSGLFGGLNLPFVGSLKMPKIGTEEILILAAALFLFLSKEGDKECAIMLILLLFVT